MAKSNGVIPSLMARFGAMYARLEVITPARARDLLERNVNVRSISLPWTRYLKNVMDRGEFVPTPDGLCFDVHGHLVNGQHRLWAIAMGDKPVMMWVWYNVPAEVIAAIDQGRKRRIADILGEDKRVTDALALSVRIATGRESVVPGSVRALLETPYGEAAARLVDHCGGATKYFSAAPIKVGAVVHMLTGDEDYVLATYADLVHSKVASLPPVARSWVNQQARGTARSTASGRYDALARALVVFDSSKSQLSKIQIGEGTKEAAAEIVRDTVGQYWRDTANEADAA